jgi:hypothetical protein
VWLVLLPPLVLLLALGQVVHQALAHAGKLY